MSFLHINQLILLLMSKECNEAIQEISVDFLNDLLEIVFLDQHYRTDICFRQKINKYSAGKKIQDII
jgi:hypothetical protein